MTEDNGVTAGTGERDPIPEHLNEVLRGLAESFHNVSWERSHAQDVARVPAGEWKTFAAAAKEAGFTFCSDVTAVDWLRNKELRFEVVANLVSMEHGMRLRMITSLGGGEPTLDSITPVWHGAGFAEREIYDMFGISFQGHPDLTRILMPDDWEGHPLRKDFGVGSVPVQFKESHKVR